MEINITAAVGILLVFTLFQYLIYRKITSEVLGNLDKHIRTELRWALSYDFSIWDPTLKRHLSLNDALSDWYRDHRNRTEESRQNTNKEA